MSTWHPIMNNIAPAHRAVTQDKRASRCSRIVVVSEANRRLPPAQSVAEDQRPNWYIRIPAADENAAKSSNQVRTHGENSEPTCRSNRRCEELQLRILADQPIPNSADPERSGTAGGTPCDRSLSSP